MTQKRSPIHGQWSSRLVYILAATGSAVGLGNIWKFPYITGENGGGAFVLVYLACVALIGVPIMMAEVLLGRRGRRSPINTMRALAEEEGRSPYWQVLGWVGVVAGFLILSYYSVVAGWSLAYVLRAATGTFVGASPEAVVGVFEDLTTDPEALLAWHSIFMVMTMFVVARGVRSGLERAVRYLMPGLFLLLMLLVGYAMHSGAFAQGVQFLFRPDFSRLSGAAVLEAMGHAFFTLSLGMGAIMTYGSYLSSRASIARTTMIIATLDTTVALLAGLAIFPLVFENGLAPGAGAGLIFQTLPIAFSQMPGGWLFATLFFVLLTLAAWTSAISLVEPTVAWLVENHGLRREKAAAAVGVTAWFLGIGSVLSFNEWSGVTLWGMTFFDLMDSLTANVMLPLGGFCLTVFAAWVMRRESTAAELRVRPRFWYEVWRVLARYVAPAAMLVVFIHALGLI